VTEDEKERVFREQLLVDLALERARAHSRLLRGFAAAVLLYLLALSVLAGAWLLILALG
jgi:hypothetical protein